MQTRAYNDGDWDGSITAGVEAGFFAGDGGYQVNVNGNTNLTGAVMASTDKAVQDHKNSLTTQTLTTSNIENKADYKADSMDISAGVGLNKQASLLSD